MTRSEPDRPIALKEAMRIVRAAGYAIVPVGRLNSDERLARLSPRERQIYDLIGKGASVEKIARHFDLSPATVERHRRSVRQRLELRSSADLTRHATLHYLLDEMAGGVAAE